MQTTLTSLIKERGQTYARLPTDGAPGRTVRMIATGETAHGPGLGRDRPPDRGRPGSDGRRTHRARVPQPGDSGRRAVRSTGACDSGSDVGRRLARSLSSPSRGWTIRLRTPNRTTSSAGPGPSCRSDLRPIDRSRPTPSFRAETSHSSRWPEPVRQARLRPATLRSDRPCAGLSMPATLPLAHGREVAIDTIFGLVVTHSCEIDRQRNRGAERATGTAA